MFPFLSFEKQDRSRRTCAAEETGRCWGRWRRLNLDCLAHARAEDASHALEAGFDKHVAKPIEPAEIVQIVADSAARARP